MPAPDLFGHTPDHELSDAELTALLHQTLLNAGRLPREKAVELAMMSAEYLVDQLRVAGLVVVERRPCA